MKEDTAASVSFYTKRDGIVGIYGRGVMPVIRELNQWGERAYKKAQSCSHDREMTRQSIERSFEQYHTLANKLRELINVPKRELTNTGWKGFVNVTLTNDHKEALGLWDCVDGGVFEGLAVYGEAGYKLSVTYNKQTTGWTASYTGQDGCGANEGYTVSAFAPTPYDAMRVLLFKVSVILPDKWKDYKNVGQDDIG